MEMSHDKEKAIEGTVMDIYSGKDLVSFKGDRKKAVGQER
jgi:hypothetical protein